MTESHLSGGFLSPDVACSRAGWLRRCQPLSTPTPVGPVIVGNSYLLWIQHLQQALAVGSVLVGGSRALPPPARDGAVSSNQQIWD